MPRSLSAQGPSPKINPNLAVVPDTGYLIPPHVMGRNIDDPTEDLVASGRRLQKPRLGVRVPYRNLTSQIVTQDEIAQEILQRSMRRNPLPPGPEVKDVFFAMKLTQRLAHRLTVPVKVEEAGGDSVNNHTEATSDMPVVTQEIPLTPTEEHTGEIEKRDKSGRIIQKLDPATERELALKQLNELPSMKKPRRRTRDPNIVMPSSSSFIVTPKKKISPKKCAEDLLKKLEMDQSIQTSVSALSPTSTSEIQNNDNKKIIRKRQNNEMLSPATPNRVIKKLKSDLITPQNNNKKSLTASSLLNGDSVKNKKTPVQSPNKVSGLPSPKSPTEPKGRGRSSLMKFDDMMMNVNNVDDQQEQQQAGSEQGSETGSVRKRRSKLRELDMLLGDEGAVNMIYEAEHGGPQGKRRQASEVALSTATNKRGMMQSRGTRGRPTRTHTMKNRQDMLLKARLVRTAVLRLSSVPQSPARPRARRRSSPPTSPSEPRSPLQNFPFPPKHPLAAEASRIIRRHSSSSSFSSRSNSPTGSPRRDRSPKQEPLQIIPGPKKKGVPIFIKKIEKTYRGKKKRFPVILPLQQNNIATVATTNNNNNDNDAQQLLKLSPKSSKKLLDAKKSKISAAMKNKLKDEMSRNFQLSVVNSGSMAQAIKKKKEMGSPFESAGMLTSVAVTSPSRHGMSESTLASLEEDATLKAIEQQLAAVVGEDLDPTSVPQSPSDQALYAPSTSSGGIMKPPPNMYKKEDVARQRQSVRQSAGTFCYREINLRRYSHLVQIILTPGSTKMKNSLNVQVLRELRDALQQLRRDEGCRVVLLSSTGSSFCQGIDVHALLHVNVDRRKKAAQELAGALKEFVRALAMFNKPLVAAVHGPAVGLGVTMLPYFDMVFASDKATFYSPYIKLGQVPEGAVAVTMPNLLGNAMASELLYGCRKLTASEALHCGLVTRILWPDRFQEELIPTLCTIASQSSQAMEATKSLLREGMRLKLDAALDAETAMLITHWQSNECQRAFKKLLEAEGVGLQRQRVDA